MWDVSILVMDFDGTVAGPKLWGPDGIALKPICGRDGTGIGMLRALGIPMHVITNELSSITECWCREHGVSHHWVEHTGNKLDILLDIIGDVPLGDICYVGDDISDVSSMNVVGCPVAVANAHPTLLNGDYYITKYPGGGGAIREVCDNIIRWRNDGIHR